MTTLLKFPLTSLLEAFTCGGREALNLDSEDEDSLREFHAVVEHRPDDVAKVLFPAESEHKALGATQRLGRYALRKAEATHYRRSGLIDAALRTERSCDWIYDRLPTFARW